MSLLEQLSIDHPYYCSDSNWFSNEPTVRHETMTEFLDDYENADIDMNLIFRWDIKNRSESEEGKKAGRYYAEVFIMHQRKGIFAPHLIANINEPEAERFKKIALEHWETLKQMWEPLSSQFS